MKIAVIIKEGELCPVEEGQKIKFYSLEKGALLAAETVDMPADIVSVLRLLGESGAKVLLCAGLSAEERVAAGKAGLTIFVKDRVSAGQALLDLLEKELIGDPEACPVGSCASCGGCH